MSVKPYAILRERREPPTLPATHSSEDGTDAAAKAGRLDVWRGAAGVPGRASAWHLPGRRYGDRARGDGAGAPEQRRGRPLRLGRRELHLPDGAQERRLLRRDRLDPAGRPDPDLRGGGWDRDQHAGER